MHWKAKICLIVQTLWCKGRYCTPPPLHYYHYIYCAALCTAPVQTHAAWLLWQTVFINIQHGVVQHKQGIRYYLILLVINGTNRDLVIWLWYIRCIYSELYVSCISIQLNIDFWKPYDRYNANNCFFLFKR